MPPPRSSLDPYGYYALLGLTPDATRDAIIAAYRAKARRLHPDVPVTGSATAFLALKQAYDVLSNQDRRSGYDREARAAAMAAIEPEVFPTRPVHFVTPASAVPFDAATPPVGHAGPGLDRARLVPDLLHRAGHHAPERCAEGPRDRYPIDGAAGRSR